MSQKVGGRFGEAPGVNAVGDGRDGFRGEVSYGHDLDARGLSSPAAGRESGGADARERVENAAFPAHVQEAFNESGGKALLVFHPPEAGSALVALVGDEAAREVVIDGNAILKARIQGVPGARGAPVRRPRPVDAGLRRRLHQPEISDLHRRRRPGLFFRHWKRPDRRPFPRRSLTRLSIVRSGGSPERSIFSPLTQPAFRTSPAPFRRA